MVWFGLSIESEKWIQEPNQTTSVFNWFGLVFDPNHKYRFFFGLDWFGSSVQLDFSDPLTPLYKGEYFNQTVKKLRIHILIIYELQYFSTKKTI